MGRDILDIVFCLVILALGLRALTRGGIPITPGWVLQGRRARLAGAFAIFAAAAFLFDRLSSRIWIPSNPDKVEVSREPAGHWQPARFGVIELHWDRAFCGPANFSILMPRNYELKRIPPRPDIGNVDGYELVHDNPSYSLVASCYTFAGDEEHPALVFDDYREEMVTSFGWKLENEADKTVEGSPARSLAFTGEKGVRQRSLLISKGTNLYQIIAEWESGSPVEKAMDDYLESFRFEPAGAVEPGSTTASP